MLAKGPVALVIAAIAGAVMLAIYRSARALRRMLPLVGPLLFLAVAAPWYVYVAQQHPEALDVWLWHTAGRFTGGVGERAGLLYYLYKAPVLLLPWPLAIAVGVYIAFRRASLPPRSKLTASSPKSRCMLRPTTP